MNKKYYCLISLFFLLILSGSAQAVELSNDTTLVPEPSNKIATFYTLTVNAQGGRVVSEPDGIDCNNTTCIYSFMANTYVALAAVAEQAYDLTAFLIDWSGGCSGSNEACRIQMTGNQSVTAAFGALGRPVALFTLTVNVGGVGTNVRVVSNPVGIDCTADDAMCTAQFSNLEAVALSATKQDSSNNLVSSFLNWTGDCTSSNTACVIALNDSDKTVNANYLVLPTSPAFTMAAPSGINTFYNHPRVAGSVAQVNDIKPFGLGENGKDLRVQLPNVLGPVDIYLGITFALNDEVYLFNPDNSISLLSSDGLVAWKSGYDGAEIDETLLSNLNWDLLPQSVYNFYVMITPAGSTADYYLWKSYRNNNFTVGNPFIE